MTNIFPTSTSLETAVIGILKESGRPLKSKEIDELVIKKLEISKDLIDVIHSGSRTEIAYRLAWVRTKAKKKGLLERLPTNQWRLINSEN